MMEDTELAYQIKKFWKENDDGNISLQMLFQMIKDKFNVSQSVIVEAIHTDLTGREFGFVI